MANKKVVPIPVRALPDEKRDTAESHARVVCHIGGKRYALDFWSRATELNPVDAPVLPFRPDSPPKR